MNTFFSNEKANKEVPTNLIYFQLISLIKGKTNFNEEESNFWLHIL